MFFIQRKAFNYITVSYIREATLFAFPVLNDKGVASNFHTGCPGIPNQVGRILRWTHSHPLLTSIKPFENEIPIAISFTVLRSLKCNELDQTKGTNNNSTQNKRFEKLIVSYLSKHLHHRWKPGFRDGLSRDSSRWFTSNISSLIHCHTILPSTPRSPSRV